MYRGFLIQALMKFVITLTRTSPPSPGHRVAGRNEKRLAGVNLILEIVYHEGSKTLRFLIYSFNFVSLRPCRAVAGRRRIGGKKFLTILSEI